MRYSQSSRLPWVAGAVLVALLVVLAVLQVRWLRAVGDADRARLEAAVERGLGGLAGELDREVSRAWLAFFPPFSAAPATREEIAGLWGRWSETAPNPELVEELLLVEHGDGARRVLRLVEGRWVVAGGRVPSLAVEAEGRRRERSRESSRHREHRHRGFALLRPELPGLEIPLRIDDDGRRGGRAAVLLVVFDRAWLTSELLPGQVRRHLGPVLGPDLAARVTVEGTGEVLWASAPGLAGRFEWEAPLFDLLPHDDLRRLAFGSGIPLRHAGEAPGEGRMWRDRRFSTFAASLMTSPGWTLAVRPAEGSLDAALARARRGNAAVGFGILLLLGLGAVALALSARRAQETARRQLEFTAAVSHELRTPLAAIRSLADNLADGVVREPAQARVYGAQIARQSERLSELVEQVLTLSAQEAGRGARRPLDLAAVVREAVEEAAAGVAAAEVETDLAAPLPRLVGDPVLLRRAVQNLVANALKHGGEPPRARVRAVPAPEEQSVRVEVSDDGPGVPAAERERIFEPFFRGQRAQDRQLPGVGLGLHLVRRAAEVHGGRVELRPAAGRGSTFALVLPVAAEGAA